MRRITTVFLCGVTLIFFCSSAWALDRILKSSNSDSTEKVTEFRQLKEKKPREGIAPNDTPLGTNVHRDDYQKRIIHRIQKPEKSKEKYDYFIDRNNNGIDDRQEREVKTKEINKRENTEKKAPTSLERIPLKVIPLPSKSEKIKDESSSENKKESSKEEKGKDRGREKR